MTVKKKLYNEKGVHIADAYVPSKAENKMFNNMSKLQAELERTKHLNDLMERKLNDLK